MDLTEQSDEQVLACAAKSREHLTVLDLDALAFEAQAQTALATFEKSPSEKSHAASAIATQKARNARAAVVEYAAQIAGEQTEATRREQRAKLAAMTFELRVWEQAAESAASRVCSLYAEFSARLTQELLDLESGLNVRNQKAVEATRLSSRPGVGSGERWATLSLERATALVNERLRENFGGFDQPAPGSTVLHAAAMRLWDVGNGHDAGCEVQIRIPHTMSRETVR